MIKSQTYGFVWNLLESDSLPLDLLLLLLHLRGGLELDLEIRRLKGSNGL